MRDIYAGIAMRLDCIEQSRQGFDRKMKLFKVDQAIGTIKAQGPCLGLVPVR
jgi:hypothetical protein